MRALYAPIEPYANGMLPVSEIHTLYFEQCGNPRSARHIFAWWTRGGSDRDYRRYFDPEAYRIILFDQRGSGRSTPHACLEENTTWHLVADLEKLREHLGIERWMVFGGSWGSTLALAYSETHPDRVTHLVLRGIFLCRADELQWFYQRGANALYPDMWEQFVAPIPAEEQGDMLRAYHRRLTSDVPEVCDPATRAWALWEASTATLIPNPAFIAEFTEPQTARSVARIECHYFVHHTFFETDNYLIENIGKVRHVPAVIVQGRYDLVCPMFSAWSLHHAWPEAEFKIIPDAGHASCEPGIIDALVEATDRFAPSSDDKGGMRNEK